MPKYVLDVIVWIEKTKENGSEPRYKTLGTQLPKPCSSSALRLGRCLPYLNRKQKYVSEGRTTKRQKES